MSKLIGIVFLITFMIPALLFVIYGILAWPFMWLWNYAVVSSISVAEPITYWVAFWLTIFLSFFIAPTKLARKNNVTSN